MRPIACLVVSATAAVVGSLSANADTFVLSGDYLRIGVGSDGSLIDDSFAVGLQYDPHGGSSFAHSGPFGAQDLLLTNPGGNAWEYFALRIGGVHYGYGATVSGVTYSLTTTDTSVGPVRSALSVGMVGGLSYTGSLSFGQNSRVINFSVSLMNSSGLSVDDIYFSRGLDPEPDYWQTGSSSSHNLRNTSARWVSAAGFVAWPSITIQDSSGGASVSVSSADWGTEDPFLLYSMPFDAGDGENRLHIAYYQPSLANGESVTWQFQYVLIPEPRAAMALTGLALLGGGWVHRRRR
jgi:hypothetical protein